MEMKSSKWLVPVIFGLFVHTANASIIDQGIYTSDTTTGYDWLDITATSGLAYNDVLKGMGSGGAFEGWRFAFDPEITNFFKDVSGKDLQLFSKTANQGITDAVGAYTGFSSGGFGHGAIFGMTANLDGGAPSLEAYASILYSVDNSKDYFSNFIEVGRDVPFVANIADYSGVNGGSWLVRESTALPEPSAIALLGLGLLGLIISRRRRA